MDINRLRYLVTVADAGSLRAAAELLRLSPAALSKGLKKLEEELGCKLIAPDGRGIVLTDIGRRIVARGRGVLEAVADLQESTAGSGRTDKAPLRIGSFEVFTTHFLDALVAAEAMPATIELHELLPGRIEEALAREQIDVGITYLPVPHPGIEHLQVTRIAMGVFGRREVFKGCPFAEMPFVVPIFPLGGTPTKAQGLDGWPDDERERCTRYRVAMMESALALCRRGLAVAYLPQFVAKLHNETAKDSLRLTRLLPDDPGKSVFAYLVKRKGTHEDRRLKMIAKALRWCGKVRL